MDALLAACTHERSLMSNKKRVATIVIDELPEGKRCAPWRPHDLAQPRFKAIDASPPTANQIIVLDDDDVCITDDPNKPRPRAWRVGDLVVAVAAAKQASTLPVAPPIIERDASDEDKEAPIKTKAWKIKDFAPKYSPFMASLLMKAPIIHGYRVRTLLATTKSALWAIDKYVEDVGIADFAPIPLVWHPKFDMYDRQCESHRSIRHFGVDELVENHEVMKVSEEAAAAPIHCAQAIILEILLRLCNDLQFGFNSSLINMYANGNEYVGAHSDKEVQPGDMVAGVAFGATRTFRIYSRTSGCIVLDVPHKEGMLLVMAGHFQKEFKHEVPIEEYVDAPRMSITFRHRRPRPLLDTSIHYRAGFIDTILSTSAEPFKMKDEFPLSPPP